MNRHIHRRGVAGFSFVELLVTIVIAAVVFAAMVPVFVSATQKNSADSARLQAANVAQDKIEKIRQLPYASIAADSSDTSSGQTLPNLYDPLFADKQFGPSTTLDTGAGSRTIFTDYNVMPYPDSASAAGEKSQYKIVTVTAYWDAPPAPVKKVVLRTIVYRQYAGPSITSFSIDPAIDNTGRIGSDDLASVTLSAHVDTSSGVMADSVQFRVSAFGGATLVSKVVKSTDGDGSYLNGTFKWTWDCSAAQTGVYDLMATAFSSDGYAGNTPHQYPRIERSLQPAPPTGALIATAGNHAVMLSWGLSPTPGVTSYEVFRGLTAAEAEGATTLVATVPQPSTAYLDVLPVTANGESYYYAVRAVGPTPPSPALRSDLLVSLAANPASPSPADTIRPNAPSSVTATPAAGAGTITLAWTAPTLADAGGIVGYEIWRSDDGASWGTSPLKYWDNLASLSYSDTTVGWATRRYYRICAVDGALNEGTPSVVVNATTVSEPRGNFTIALRTSGNANSRSACNVWVLRVANGHYYDLGGVDRGTTPPAATYIPLNGTATFLSLPYGAYTVFCDWVPSSYPAKTYGITVSALSSSLTGVGP